MSIRQQSCHYLTVWSVALYFPDAQRLHDMHIFDGVLHPDSVFLHPRYGPTLRGCDGHSMFEHVELLEDVLAPYPEVRIVLSTSWVRRYRGSLVRVARGLTPGLRRRVVGATFHSAMSAVEFGQMSRGMQVWQDVMRRKPSVWIALDDYEHWPEWCAEHLVRSDPVLGISEPAVLAELRSKLAAMSPEA